MNDFIFDYNDFISIFSDFEAYFSQDRVLSKLTLVRLLYSGLFENDTDDEHLRKELVYLALAHLLALEQNPSSTGGRIKNIKNRQDSITYAITDSNSVYDLQMTMYGQLLAQKIDLMSMCGFVSYGCDLGNLGNYESEYC
ncbi:MAG: hypothetical protein RLZZ171_985 [Cyanobacteriota bacterium]|jgi:hypothetical protein